MSNTISARVVTAELASTGKLIKTLTIFASTNKQLDFIVFKVINCLSVKFMSFPVKRAELSASNPTRVSELAFTLFELCVWGLSLESWGLLDFFGHFQKGSSHFWQYLHLYFLLVFRDLISEVSFSSKTIVAKSFFRYFRIFEFSEKSSRSL